MARMDMSTVEQAEYAGQAATPDTLLQLGLRYSTGREAAPDLVVAHKWFNLAALRGNRDAREYRMEIAREMSEAEIALAQKQAREWLARH